MIESPMTVTRGFASVPAAADTAARRVRETIARKASAPAIARLLRGCGRKLVVGLRCIGLGTLFGVRADLLFLLVRLFLGDHLGDRALGFRVLLLRLGHRGSLGLSLRRLERRELFLRRKLSALGNDQRLHLDLDVLEELDGDRETTDPLERVGSDLAPVDADLA